MNTSAYWKILHFKTIFSLILIFILIIYGIMAIADEEEHGEEYAKGEKEVEKGDIAESLGSLAAWGGGVLVAGFIIFREAFLRLAKAGVRLPTRSFRAALVIHATTSMIFGLAGIYHGYLLRTHAGIIEYALVTVILFTLTSGVVLWFSRGSKRLFARLLHAQRLLAFIILLLVIIHIITIKD